ncbi:hypothetical protein V2J09_004836 [Rumex salicifolius]
MDSSSSEEQPPPPPPQQSPRREEFPKECLHKTKTIQFFNRSTPIILQNDNGPCPLLAICNVLLLRNQLNLSVDIGEVSQEKLLSLVAERLIDSNSNTDNKGAEYVQNQQQNISDAIDLLPRLTTGIDVNIKFQRIGDFEFTPECAIFDLLDIPLYHGWLVDPQDYATAKAIGSKSYNTITRELVSLQEVVGNEKDKSVEDSVDFAAATAATLGVPSPCLTRAKSSNDSPRAASDESDVRIGDALEAAELLRVLKLSENNSSIEESDCITAGRNGENVNFDEHLHHKQVIAMSSNDKQLEHDLNGKVQGEPSISGENDLPSSRDDLIPHDGPDDADHSSAKLILSRPDDQHSFSQSGGSLPEDLTKVDSAPWDQNETNPSPNSEISFLPLHDQDTQLIPSTDGLMETTTLNGHEHLALTLLDANLQIDSPLDVGLGEKTYKESGIEKSTVFSGPSDSSSGNIQNIQATESFTSSLNDSEPIYEGEECIFDSVATVCEDQEPIYEGEGILAKQGDGIDINVRNTCSKDEITSEEGELISNFLKNNASQLTFHGLFSLQDGLKDRELCVFFRNNHFSTMFKFDRELYLLTTDQGYLNQPGIVWEKLNEVNGDSVFYDSGFKEFRPETEANGSWDEQNVLANTADYLASFGNSGQDSSNINSDLQLAIALQQQEFEQQQQQQQQQQPQPQRRAPQQPSAAGGSRLITGPQTRPSARPSTSSPKQDKKSKDSCCIIYIITF